MRATTLPLTQNLTMSILGFAMVQGSVLAKPVAAAPYTPQKVEACFPEPGKIDLPCTAKAFAALEAVASNWPPITDSDADKKKAADDAVKLHQGMLAAMKNVSDTKDLFFRLAFSAHLGHNLDAPGMGARANELYKAYLKQYPDDVRANYLYGVFLSGVNGGQQGAFPYLEKALSLGEKKANYTLAATYVITGDKEKAKTALQAYLKDFPQDEKAKTLLHAIESGQTIVSTAPSGK